jgi:predicted permease
MIDLLTAVPGVQSAASVAVVPVSGSSGSNEIWPEGDRTRGAETSINMVGRGYFATMGIPLVAGRDFDGRDTPGSTVVAIVNETFAARLGGPAAAIGRRVTREATPRQPEQTYEIVGVVRNSTYESLKEDTHPVAYYADEQAQGGRYVQAIIRTAVPAATATSAISAAITSADRRIRISYTVLPTMIQDSLVQERVVAALSGGFGALAALLTMVGLYGLIAYSVSRRTGEIGIRMALGAARWDIARLLMVETAQLLAIGTGCGIALAIAGGRAAETLLFGVEPYDPATLAAAAGLLSAIAMAATIAPARRATRIQPVAALRAD